MAETDVYRILGEFAKVNSGYPLIKYFFNLRNAYNFNKDDLTPIDHSKAMERKITLTVDSREIILNN